MRPIDADILIPLIQEEKIEGETLNIIKVLGEGLQAETLNQACDRHIKIIRELPTIESKRGMWIKATGMMPPEFHGHYCCSECGNFANMKPPFGNREDLSKFCPSCGARMDRSEE